MRIDQAIDIHCKGETTKLSPEKLLALHNQHEGTIVKQLTEQGRKIRMVQSSSKYQDKNGEGLCTMLYNGFTTAPDLRTYVVTYDCGVTDSWDEKLNSRGSR